MKLGTIKEAVSRLRELGYGDKAIEALESHTGTHVERLEFSDPVQLGDHVVNIDWQLRIDGLGEVSAPPLTVAMLHVPIEHALIQGIDTATLEKQMQGIDWSDLDLNDREALKVMGLMNQLSRSDDPKAEAIADQLALKYWSWQPVSENNLYLEELKQERMVSKTYEELPRFSKAYRELTDLLGEKQKMLNQHERPMSLSTPNAADLIRDLQRAQSEGMTHALVSYRPSDEQLNSRHLDYFPSEGEALDETDRRDAIAGMTEGSDRVLYCMAIERLVDQVRRDNPELQTVKGVNTELAEKLNAAGYHGWEIVHALSDIYQQSPHSAKVNFIEVLDQRPILFQMDVRFYLGGAAQCQQLHACPVRADDLDKIFELMRSGPEGLPEGTRWQSFEGLPKLADVNAALVKERLTAKIIEHQFIHPSNEKPMNLNNLQNLKDEAKALGFSNTTIQAMEENMRKNLPEFTLHEKVTGTRGQVDVTIPFRQSRQSEYYYLNKFTVALNSGKPLPEGEKYMVISPNPQKAGSNLVRSFERSADAIAFFRDQQGNSELAAGKDAAHKTTLASRENGVDNFVAPDFQRAYRASAITQTIYVERGVGFTMQQAANLIEGRSVFRDDLLSPEKGPHEAWVKLNMDKEKDRFGNFAINTYHVPEYGFDLKEVLDQFKIKELNEPKQKEALIAALHQGDRPTVTVMKDGKETSLHIQAAPQYKNVSFYREDGRAEKREQFMKEPAQDQKLNKDQGKSKEKGKDNDQGLEV